VSKIPSGGDAIHKILLCLCVYILTVPGTAFADTGHQPADPEKVFRLAKVTSNPLKQHQRLQPMADLLAEKMQLKKGDTLFAKNILAMQEKLESGDVDLFTGSAYEAAALIESGVGEALALKFKEGTSEYKSIIVVHEDSNIETIGQLNGKLIAFEDPDSTSAFRVPFIELKNAGLKLAESRYKPADHKVVHYRFSGSEQNSSALLYRRTVDAIALSNLDWTRNENVPDFQRNQFKIIHSSPPIPRAIEVIRSSLDKDTKARLQEILLNLHKDKKASRVMRSYHKTTEFSPVSNETLTYLEKLGKYFKN